MKQIIILTQQDVEQGIVNYHRRIKELERDNAKFQPFSERGWLEIFPEAESLVIKRLGKHKQQAQELESKIKDSLILIHKHCKSKESIDFWKNVVQYLYVDNLNKLFKRIKSLSWTLIKKEDIKKYEVTDEMITAAKEYPFEYLIEANKTGFAPCPFHKEEKPSFYIKNNFGYCFGCGKSCDTIQFIMETQKLSFIETIRYLNGL